MRKDFRKNTLKTISLVLTVIMVFSVMPVNMGMLLKSSATVVRGGEERTVVVASSDYQFPIQSTNQSSEDYKRYQVYKNYVDSKIFRSGSVTATSQRPQISTHIWILTRS